MHLKCYIKFIRFRKKLLFTVSKVVAMSREAINNSRRCMYAHALWQIVVASYSISTAVLHLRSHHQASSHGSVTHPSVPSVAFLLASSPLDDLSVFSLSSGMGSGCETTEIIDIPSSSDEKLSDRW